jgi:hypothetical protein
MIANLVDLLFGCWHKNYSFPLSVQRGARRTAAAGATGTYVVCLDCGKEFAYDWQRMKVVGPEPAPARAVANTAESMVGR